MTHRDRREYLKKYRANISPEQREKYNQARREKIANRSPEQREKALRQRRVLYENRSPEQRKHALEQHRAWCKTLSPEYVEERNRKNRECWKSLPHELKVEARKRWLASRSPEQIEGMKQYQKEYCVSYAYKNREALNTKSRKRVAQLPDGYVIQQLIKRGTGRTGCTAKPLLSRDDIPKELIEAKRLQLKLRRQIGKMI